MSVSPDLVNGQTMPPSRTQEQGLQRYVLSHAERVALLKMTEVMVRTEAAIQGAMQLIIEQQGLQSSRGFRLEKDCSALVEQ